MVRSNLELSSKLRLNVNEFRNIIFSALIIKRLQIVLVYMISNQMQWDSIFYAESNAKFH